MHYANGREAKNGDMVVFRPSGQSAPVIGILYAAMAGNDTCNGRLAIPRQQSDPWPNLRECLHVDDAVNPLPGTPATVNEPVPKGGVD